MTHPCIQRDIIFLLFDFLTKWVLQARRRPPPETEAEAEARVWARQRSPPEAEDEVET
jgi:hypothetical protein